MPSINTPARDWQSTLWRASYKGFPFWFERDEAQGGRGIVTHVFPNSDQPFNEDLGEDPRYFSGNAYVHGDDADAQSSAFERVLVTPGPGVLVIPTAGPVNVRLVNFKRTSDKDRNGYICFEVRFVREGLAGAIVSVPYLGNAAAIAATALGDAIVAAAPVMIDVLDEPDFVATAAVDQVAAVIGAIDAVRTSYPVDTDSSAKVSTTLQAINNALDPLLDQNGAAAQDLTDFAALLDIVPAPADGVTAVATALNMAVTVLGDGMDPAVAQDAMASLADTFATVTPLSPALSSNAAAAEANVAGALQLARLMALNAWANAVIARTYTDRPSAVTARAEAAERFERELNECPGQDFAQLFVAIEELQGAVVDYLTQLMTNLAPVVTIEAQLAMPSLVVAWQIYQDPTRCYDLVLRNKVRHPSFMPRQFEALAPGYDAPGLPAGWPPTPL
jgi:prophage DNA circulation protein